MTIEFIDEYHELGKPTQSSGKLWSICGNGTWHECMLYLLNGDRPYLCDLGKIAYDDIEGSLYFKTEWECHQAACKYYTKHNRLYPYLKAWSKCETHEPKLKDNLESEIMVFK